MHTAEGRVKGRYDEYGDAGFRRKNLREYRNRAGCGESAVRGRYAIGKGDRGDKKSLGMR